MGLTQAVEGISFDEDILTLVTENLSIEQALGEEAGSLTVEEYQTFLEGLYADDTDFEATGIEVPELTEIPEGYCSDELYEAQTAANNAVNEANADQGFAQWLEEVLTPEHCGEFAALVSSMDLNVLFDSAIT
jgi:hypothetical protein